MADPYMSKIQSFGFNFAPRGWAKCEGQLLPIAQNTALFSLLGTMYGGDGRTNFGLPDLRGRASFQAGRGPGLSVYSQGEKGGTEQVTLTELNLANHTHTARVAAEAADSSKPGGSALAGATIYKDHNPDTDLRAATITNTGGGQPFDNRQPFLVVNWCIALVGNYPQRS